MWHPTLVPRQEGDYAHEQAEGGSNISRGEVRRLHGLKIHGAGFILATLFAIGLIVLNHFVLQSPAAGVVIGLSYLIGYGLWLGRRFLPDISLPAQMTIGILLWVMILTIISGLTYRLWNLQSRAILAVVTLSPFLLAIIAALRLSCISSQITDSHSIAHERTNQFTINNWLLGPSLVVLAGIAVVLLWSARTGEALRSPWTVVSSVFFAIIFIANLAAMALGLHTRETRSQTTTHQWLLLFLLTSLTLAVGFVVYEVGYGFDPFVHQAAETLIVKNGLVEPKPWYYLGQYGLVVVLATIFEANITLVDKLLLPLVAAVTLPTILLIALNNRTADRRTTLFAALAILVLPITWFINTTPQGFANLVLLSLIFAAFATREQKSSAAAAPLIGLALAALIIHPLSGLPALMFILFRFVPSEPRARWWRRTIALGILLGAILPLLFLAQEHIHSSALPLLPQPQEGFDPSFTGWLYFEQRFNLVLDTIYYVAFNLPLILLGLAAIGIFISYRSRLLWPNTPYLTTAALVAADGLVLNRFLPFSFLINYERTAYGDRLLEISLFFLLPFAAVALLAFFQKLLSAAAPVILFWIVTLAAVRTIGVYITYPRFDTYAYDRGYSTSIHDLEAVRVIEAEAHSPYIVLANQAVSAAALHELGFKQYFQRRDKPSNEQIFFYPIPTGGSLYQYYLKMVYESPSRKTVEEAMRMVGVNEAYFVLSDYWADSKKIAAAAKAEADNWQTIDGGKIYIFKYIR